MDGDGRFNSTKYECLLFDMDDTLYPLSSGLNLACRKNIQEYMLNTLQIEESEVPRMCLELYKEYGTTMAGLKELGFEFDNDEFHENVHGRLPYETLKPDPVLRNLLLSMPQRKIIFTNADKGHVAQVLSRMGLEDCFGGVICFETLNPPFEPEEDDANDKKVIDRHPEEDNVNDKEVINCADDGDRHPEEDNVNDKEVINCADDGDSPIPKSRIICKPSLEAMEAAIQIANINPEKTIFFDDSARNIATGKAAGLHTVIVGSSDLVSGADVALSSIHNIKEALPEIWDDEEGDQVEAVLPSAAVETVVLA
eukprot:TRINITY_DN760_c0_g1_i1.p1 TRINITY_DN760_c0_g1~~TRINITY_DN760_c0_g1_i1.p1  ORF type:complete len:311 (+),score=75.38 TRINITY_DN760_c0_g1_i1:33-965(+)